jgi:hypothetical protein
MTTSLVRQAGFRDACTNFSGTIDAATALYELPRLYVRDWSGDEFFRALSLQVAPAR